MSASVQILDGRQPAVARDTSDEDDVTTPTWSTRPEELADVHIARWFQLRREQNADRVAFRHKHLGIWREVSWAEYGLAVEDTAYGLMSLGVEAGDRVAMMGDPTEEWLYFDLAAQSIGAIFLGIYVTTRPEDVRYVLEDSTPRVFLAEDQEYVDKLFDAEVSGTQLVDHVVVADMRGMFQYNDRRLMSFSDLRVKGAALRDQQPRRWVEGLSHRNPDDVTRISYTSGTTGKPKGAMLSSRNLVWSVAALYQSIELFPGPDDRTVSYMPPASPAEVFYSILLPVLYGSVPHIPDEMSSRGVAFVEVCPTLLLAFPRMWETYASRALIEMEVGRRTKRWAYHIAMRWASRYHRMLWEGERPSVATILKQRAAHLAVFRHLLDKFGLGRTRFVITGGAPVSPDILRLWNTWGVGVQEIYGMTEVAGLATVQMDGRPMPGVAGKPIHGMEIQLAADGEILLRSQSVFCGYWQKESATRDVIDSDGWLHTGDIGTILPDGNLKVVDRRGDLLELTSGRVVPASEVEHMLKRSPYIREAMLAGSERPFLTVLVEIDVESVSEWARAEKIVYTSFNSLVENLEVIELVRSTVGEVNAELERLDKPTIHDFRILPKELDPEEGDEITSTNKVRRRQLAQKFAELLDDMYGSTAGAQSEA